jgi:predicted MFS family arabinose efflux permease
LDPDKNPLAATDGTEAAHPRPPEPRAGVTGDTLADPTAQLQSPARNSGITLTQYAVLVAAGAFATTFAQQRVLANYPTTFLLKDHLHLRKEDVAVFFFWATFAWNLKPLAGILTDAFPLLGTRRRSYMILGAGAAGVLWLVMGLYPNAYLPLLLVSVGMNIATVVASTVMGGLMVEAGQAYAAPGRISSLRQFVQSIAGIGAPLLGGWLASRAFGWSATTTIAAITVLSLAALTAFVLREKPVPRTQPGEVADRERPRVRVPPGAILGVLAAAGLAIYLCRAPQTRDIGISLIALLGMLVLILLLIVAPSHNPVILRAQGQLAQILESRTLWMAVVMLFLVYTVPGLGTALTYRQEDVLNFSKPFIGLMGSLEGVFGVIAAVVYGVFCRKLNLRVLLVGGIAVNAAATLLYLVYTRGSAPYIHSLGGFVVILSELALMDLAVRSTPVGCEALGFSLMMSVRNFGIALSDVLGTKLMDEYHMAFNTLVWVNAGTTFVILLFVPLLPRLIMLRREGEPDAESGPASPEQAVPE